MKNFFLLGLAITLCSLWYHKQNNPIIPSNYWVQYVGEDSIKHIYKFKDTLGTKILQSIIVEEKNPGNGGKTIFSNSISFDKKGKIKRVGVTRSVNVVQDEYEKGKYLTSYNYDEDAIIFENDTFRLFELTNGGKRIAYLSRGGNFLYSVNKDIYHPVYNYNNPKFPIQFRPIGKSVDANMSTSEFNKQTNKNLYKKYKMR